MLFELDFETSYKEFDLADCRCHIHKLQCSKTQYAVWEFYKFIRL